MNINIQEVRNNPTLPWDRAALSHNKDITLGDVESLQLPNATDNWNHAIIGSMKTSKCIGYTCWFEMTLDINIQEVRDKPYLPWNRTGLSCNKGITIHDIMTLHLPYAQDVWDWNAISMNINIQEVRENPHMPWHRQGLSCNSNITIYDIQTLELPNAIGDWNWRYISSHINIQEIRRYYYIEWDKEGLSYNKNLTVRDIDLISINRGDVIYRDTIPIEIVDTLYDIVIV